MPSAKLPQTINSHARPQQITTADNPPRPQPSIPRTLSTCNSNSDLTKLRVYRIWSGFSDGIDVSIRRVDVFKKWDRLPRDATIRSVNVSSQSQIPLRRFAYIVSLWVSADSGAFVGQSVLDDVF